MTLLSAVAAVDETPIDRYLQLQGDLTAVERFSQRHEADVLPVQARYYRDLIGQILAADHVDGDRQGTDRKPGASAGDNDRLGIVLRSRFGCGRFVGLGCSQVRGREDEHGAGHGADWETQWKTPSA